MRSEILFVAGINPAARPVDCTEEQLKKAAEATISLVKQSYETGGITNDVKLAETLKERPKALSNTATGFLTVKEKLAELTARLS